MIQLEYVYILAGLLFGVTAVLEFLDRANPKRWRKTVFWGIVRTNIYTYNEKV